MSTVRDVLSSLSYSTSKQRRGVEQRCCRRLYYKLTGVAARRAVMNSETGMQNKNSRTGAGWLAGELYLLWLLGPGK